MKLSIILAEFDRVPNDLENIKRFFPEASIRVYGKKDCPDIFAHNYRWGHHMNNYYKMAKLLETGADIAMSFDGDMHIVSDRVRALPMLANKFGFCLPANPRKLVSIDATIGNCGDSNLDETMGTGYAYNCTPLAINLHDQRATNFVKTFCRLLKNKPVRGPLSFYRTAYATGYAPYLLPPQWCVCAEDVGIGNEIILHVGHAKVREFYKI